MKHQAVILNFDKKSVRYVRIDEVASPITKNTGTKFIAVPSTPPPHPRRGS